MTPDLKQLLLDLAHLQHSDVSVAIDAIYLIEELERQLAEAQVFEALWTGACEVAKNDPVQAIYRLREQVDGGKSVYLAMHERNNLLETVAKQDAEITELRRQLAATEH